MTKISPIATFLTENKVITKRSGNVCHFYTPEGLYIGKQTRIEQGITTAFIREIFGEGLKRLFYEFKAISEQCVYFKYDKSPIGFGLLPINTYILSHFIDFTSDSVKTYQKHRVLKNEMQLIAIDKNTNTGIFNIKEPFKYSEQTIEQKDFTLKRRNRIKHTVH